MPIEHKSLHHCVNIGLTYLKDSVSVAMLAELILSFLLAPKAPGSWLVGREEGAAQVPVPYREIPRQAGPDVVGVGRVRLLQDQAPRIPQQHHPARRAEAKDLQEVR